MFNMNSKGYWEPTKMFPCDCGGEGFSMTLFVDGVYGEEDYFDVALWQQRMTWETDSMPWKIRIRCAWAGLCGRPWRSQVSMTTDTARNLANHILYQISKRKKSEKVESKEENRQAFFLKGGVDV